MPQPRCSIVYCVVPEDLAAALHEPLRHHFADRPGVEVVVEQRWRDRRHREDRRAAGLRGEPGEAERRRIRAEQGRRVADRRAAPVGVDPPAGLPPAAAKLADRLVFVEWQEPATEELEDRDTAQLIGRYQAGDRDVFGTLYLRYFDRVYTYLRLLYHDAAQAEDATQDIFMKVLAHLDRYERRSQPFRAWLFTIVRNHALSHLRRAGRMTPVDPELVDRQRDRPMDDDAAETALNWLTDRHLAQFIERLPLAQRKVLMLRYMLALPLGEIAQILGYERAYVRQLHSRGLTSLRSHLAAAGRVSAHGGLAL